MDKTRASEARIAGSIPAGGTKKTAYSPSLGYWGRFFGKTVIPTSKRY